MPKLEIRFSDLRPKKAPISLASLQGPFILLLIALALAVIIGLLEVGYSWLVKWAGTN